MPGAILPSRSLQADERGRRRRQCSQGAIGLQAALDGAAHGGQERRLIAEAVAGEGDRDASRVEPAGILGGEVPVHQLGQRSIERVFDRRHAGRAAGS